MATRDEKGRFVSSDSGPSEGKRQEDITVGSAEQRERFEESINRRHAGRDIDTAAERAHDIIASEGDEPRPDAPSAEDREAARERARETGRLEDAAAALEQELKAAESEGADGESAEARAIRFSELAEELGVEADSFMVTAKVDGEEVEMPLSEAVQGYQRQKDYTRKTQALAEERQEVQELQQQHAKALEVIGLTLGQHLDEPTRQQIAQQYNQIVGQLQAEQQANLQETIAEQQEKLAEKLGWEDETDARLGKQQLRGYARQLGFHDRELDQVVDARLVEVLDKARRWDEAQGRGDGGPVQLNPGTRNPRQSRAKRKSKAQQKAIQKVRRSGSIDDAAEAIAGIDGLLD